LVTIQITTTLDLGLDLPVMGITLT
jgi:hypothetical protein